MHNLKDYFLQTTGEFCDCEGSSCPKFDGKLCAGQGECSCGECRCEEGFAGDDCSCNLDTTPCVEGGVGLITLFLFVSNISNIDSRQAILTWKNVLVTRFLWSFTLFVGNS